MNKLKTKQQGFTIIEVMIVLVIASVILLIVFLAVPALQRNSRNNQRKNDVSRLLSAITEWSNNNNGKLPTTDDEKVSALLNVGQGSYYSEAPTWQSGKVTNSMDAEHITIVTKASCDANGDDTVSAASGRRFAVLYAVETGSGTPDKTCTES